jgi:hypothetical protein
MPCRNKQGLLLPLTPLVLAQRDHEQKQLRSSSRVKHQLNKTMQHRQQPRGRQLSCSGLLRSRHSQALHLQD